MAKDEHLLIEKQRRKNKRLQKEGKPQLVYDLIKENHEEDIETATGEKFCVCETCGKTFEQDYIEELNRYQSFKKCHACRWKIAKKIQEEREIEELTTSVVKYSPYPWQAKLHEDMKSHRFVVIAAGARTGKDRASNMQMIIQYATIAQENRHIKDPDLVPSILMWIVAPTFPMAIQNWRELKSFFPKEWVVSISESTMTMQCAYGGVIEVRSAHDPESLVGVGLDFVTITEAARVKDLEAVWGNLEDRLNSTNRGIGGKGGQAVINSSPLGKNYFYKMWTWGQKNHSNYDSNFISYKLPTTENPRQAELYAQLVTTKTGEVITYGESLKRRKGRKFLQDNMAEFIGTGGIVFEDFSEKCVVDLYSNPDIVGKEARKEFAENWKKPKPFHTYRIGYDPATGSGGDNPILSIREMETNRIVRGFDMYGKKDEVQWDFVAAQARIYNDAEVCLLTTGFLSLQGQLENRGCIVTPLIEGGTRKAMYVQALQTAVQNEDVHVLDDGSEEIQTLIFQMEDYTEKSNGKYSNDTEANDDYVTATYATYYDYNLVEEEHNYYEPRMMGIKH